MPKIFPWKLIVTQFVKKFSFLWYLEIHCRVHNSPLQNPIMKQWHSVHKFALSFSNICFIYVPIYAKVLKVVFSHQIRKPFCYVVISLSKKDHPLSAVRKCPFSIFAFVLHILRQCPTSATWIRAVVKRGKNFMGYISFTWDISFTVNNISAGHRGRAV
jgi:hypothetical protein